ncbi:hypothetical protein OZX56_00760 [Lactobacillus sp. ESL0684]|uniref:hypothetical protein n=1 Tax=unclassified Lactobacillus TaxID=2620435 RepID=UPI0023F9159A|nr:MULTISPECIES: hypothetical protein [unclassified Lactobacillus]WEV39669.1 hypothetical protein OZX59_05480 [Lactobacillus sp. ESL0681]WEV43800.1 hypothetical protein OZX56_00760 [Lactobacillus sp. ESL0684]
MEKDLGNIIARKTGNSVSLTIPAKAKVKVGQKFKLVQEDSDTLIYKAIDANPWFNGDYDNVDFRKEMSDVGNPDTMQVGKENIAW